MAASDQATAVLPARPKLREDVVVHEPSEPGAPWMIEREGRSFYRVGADIARLATMLSGEHDAEELVELLGPPWDEAAVTAGVRKFQGLGLLDDGSQKRRSSRRVVLVPPMTIQISLFDPSRVLTRLPRLIAVLGRPGALGVMAGVILAGLVALVWSWESVYDLVSRPVGTEALLIALVGGFVFTAIHELAHGATLVHYGGRPRRLGIMLFYFLPAFFCDVSDGWRLPRNEQRVRVALAGIFAQFVCAGAAALAAVAAPEGWWKDGLLLLAISMFVATTMNFIPFVKLDGYLALMSALDLSNLRSTAMDDARNLLAARLFGARRSPRLPGRRWVAPFGLVSMVFPLYLVGFVAFGLWADAIIASGFLGAMLVLTALSGLVYAVLRGAVRLVVSAREQGAGLPRLVVVSGLLAGLAALAVLQVSPQTKVPGVYVTEGERVSLLVPGTSVVDQLEPGQRVELRSNGLIVRRPLGEARVGEGGTREVSRSSTSFMPLDLGIDTPATYVEVPLEVLDAPTQDEGRARVDLGRQPLWRWAYIKYVTPVL